MIRGGGGVAVGGAEGFFDDVVDGAEFEIVVGGEVKLLRGGLSFFACFPENGGAAFGADDRVPGVAHHGDTVGDTDAEGAA